MTEECFSSGFSIENQYIPIQVVLELQEAPEIINRDSIHSYSVCTTAPRVPIILLIWRPPFLILAGWGGFPPPQIKQVLGLVLFSYTSTTHSSIALKATIISRALTLIRLVY